MNPVSVLEPKLDPQDREVLCSAMRHCSATPNISKDGRASSCCATNRIWTLQIRWQNACSGLRAEKNRCSLHMLNRP